MIVRSLILLFLTLAPISLWAAQPARVLIVGTYHFSNPGQDQANVDSVDVTTPVRQAEIEAIMRSLAKFEPTMVGVEWPAGQATSDYARYLEGKLPPSSNEVVQLGFRLAKQRGLANVHGLDVPGEFPFEAVQQWAKENGKEDALASLMQQAQGITARITALQTTHSIGGVLHEMNTQRAISESASFYAEFLRYGEGDAQPGVALNAAWTKRNLGICALLLQSLRPGDRAVVFYGQGHVALLTQCLDDAPGVVLVQANDYLPKH